MSSKSVKMVEAEIIGKYFNSIDSLCLHTVTVGVQNVLG